MKAGETVVWVHTVNTPSGKTMKRTEVKVVTIEAVWATVELADGERFAVQRWQLHRKREGAMKITAELLDSTYLKLQDLPAGDNQELDAAFARSALAGHLHETIVAALLGSAREGTAPDDVLVGIFRSGLQLGYALGQIAETQRYGDLQPNSGN